MALPLDFRWTHEKPPKTDAVVTVRQHSLFRQKAGTVHISGKNPCKIKVIVPKWNEKTTELEAFLYRCYREILEAAEKNHCKTVLLPLLSAKTGFPRSLDDHIANDVLRAFAAEHDMNVYLLRDRADPVDDEANRLLLEQHIASASREVLRELQKEARLLRNSRRRKQTERPVVHEDILGVPDIDEAFSPEAETASEKDGLPVIHSEVSAGYGLPIETEECTWAEPQMTCGPINLPEYGTSVTPPAAGISEDCCTPSPSPSLAELLLDTDAGFSDTLFMLIDASGKKDSEIYNRANVSRQHFSKIRSNRFYKPTKPTVLAFAIALELTLEQTEMLLATAGFTLSKSFKFDIIVKYHIERQNYNLGSINAALFEYDQPLLG